jgi:DNA-binding NarL/FixJ family response regulator
VALSEGNAADACTPLTEAVALLEAIGVVEPGAFPVLPDAIEALARSGDIGRAEVLLARLESQAESAENAWAQAGANRGRGVILLSSGQPEEAVPPLRGSADAFDQLGFRPDAARAVLLLGQALLRGGHRTAAADALEDARERFASMGAATWEARALEELERSAPGRGSGELTPTERQIAALVADGMKNRQIAHAMFVSVATVEAHLTRIYRKLQIGSRAGLTRMVIERGLLADPDK